MPCNMLPFDRRSTGLGAAQPVEFRYCDGINAALFDTSDHPLEGWPICILPRKPGIHESLRHIPTSFRTVPFQFGGLRVQGHPKLRLFIRRNPYIQSNVHSSHYSDCTACKGVGARRGRVRRVCIHNPFSVYSRPCRRYGARFCVYACVRDESPPVYADSSAPAAPGPAVGPCRRVAGWLRRQAVDARHLLAGRAAVMSGLWLPYRAVLRGVGQRRIDDRRRFVGKQRLDLDAFQGDFLPVQPVFGTIDDSADGKASRYVPRDDAVVAALRNAGRPRNPFTARRLKERLVRLEPPAPFHRRSPLRLELIWTPMLGTKRLRELNLALVEFYAPGLAAAPASTPRTGWRACTRSRSASVPSASLSGPFRRSSFCPGAAAPVAASALPSQCTR